MSKFYGLKLGVDEMQRVLDRQLAGIASIKSAIWSYFNGISVLLALGGALNILGVKVAAGWAVWFSLGFGVVMALYAALAGLFTFALLPVRLTLPIAVEWDELVKTFHDKSEEEATDALLIALINAINQNKPILNRLLRLEQMIGVLFGVVVFLLMLLALIPRA